MASMPIEPTAASEAITAPEQDTNAPGSTIPVTQSNTILKDRNDAVTMKPNDTDAMNIKPSANFPGAGVALADPAVAASENFPTETTNKVPMSHTTHGHDPKKGKLPGMGINDAETPKPPGFKEKVQGFAKIFRGHATGNKELKDHGKGVLSGERQL